MVGGSEGSVTDPRADADGLNRPVGIAKVILNLLQGPRREEARRGHCENFFPGCGQACRHPHQVLLRDTDFHDLARCSIGEERSAEPLESLVAAEKVRILGKGFKASLEEPYRSQCFSITQWQLPPPPNWALPSRLRPCGLGGHLASSP